MKHINAGVNIDISVQIYKILYFTGWKSVNTPFPVWNQPLPCETSDEIEGTDWDSSTSWNLYKKRLLTPSNQRWAIPPASVPTPEWEYAKFANFQIHADRDSSS